MTTDERREVEEALKCESASVNWKMENLKRCADALTPLAREVRRLEGELANANLKFTSLRQGTCHCPGAGELEQAHYDSCPEIAAKLMSGYCDRIKELKARAEAVEGELTKEQAIAEEWHKAHWKADMAAVNEYRAQTAISIARAEAAEQEAARLREQLEVTYEHMGASHKKDQAALAAARADAERLREALQGFAEYFTAIRDGKVGGSRPTIRTFEMILLDKSRAALTTPAAKDEKPKETI